MARTLTSTAYLATPKEIHVGVNAISFSYTNAAGAGNSLSSSANSTILLGARIPNGSTLIEIIGAHSSGADTMPVDIGIDGSISKFFSQKTQLTRAIAAKGSNLPFKISVTDNAANQWRSVNFGITPGTDTALAMFNYTIYFMKDATT